MPDISLKRLMIFNSSEGQHESREGDKLLYHWTKDSDVSQTDKINDICLCDASVNVGHRLSRDKSDSKTSKEQKMILFFEQTVVVILDIEPEQSIWMAVHVHCNSLQETEHPIDTSNVLVGAIEQIMKNIYERFCLLNGTFRTIASETTKDQKSVDKDDLATLIRDRTRSICEDYFNTVLPDIHLNSILANVSSLYNYIQYLDLQPLTLMRLIWSGLEMHDTRILYGYMVSVLIRDALQEELSKEVSKVRRIRESMPIYLRGVIVGGEESSNRITKSYLSVFRSRNMTLGLIMSEPDLFDLIDKCEKILTSDSRLGVIPLASLAQSVGQNYLKSSQQQPVATHSSGTNPSQAAAAPAEYICMDQIDASVRCPLSFDKEHLIQADNLGSENHSKKSRLVKYLIELESEFRDIEQEFGSKMEEFYARTLGDSWLMATNSSYKTIYSLHHSRNSSLSDAQQSANTLKMNLLRNKH